MYALNDLFMTTLKDVYFAERQLLKALPRMARAAQSQQLREAFLEHREQTQEQVARLTRVFEIIGKRARGQTCEAMMGLIQESEELLEEATEPSPVRDAGLIACGQAVEHYEIARYGTLAAWAETLGHSEAADLLRETLEEEKATDTLLNQIALNDINLEAKQEA